MHPSVTFLNFDNTYTWQRNLLRFPHEWIDMYDIEGTNLYCDDDAIKEIEKKNCTSPYERDDVDRKR
ncbi:hypothetical protein LR68_01842 [Anoxybacillus sp. BCO1]|nr:hypothetical protein LR68_01842 [Anoxybacillus sp. BCO1]